MTATINEKGETMGTFDKYLDKAGSMASGLAGQAEKTGRVAQAQLKLRSLQGEAKDANAELGALVARTRRAWRALAPRARVGARQGPGRRGARAREGGGDRAPQGGR